MSFQHSIFENVATTDSAKFRLWRKANDLHSIISKLKDENDFQAFKKTKENPSDLVERCFFFRGNNLCYKKRKQSSRVSGVMNLSWVRIEIDTLEMGDDDEKKEVYEVTFIKNLKFCSVILENQKNFRNLLDVLSKNCILTELYKKYKLGKKIGSGSSGFVRFKN